MEFEKLGSLAIIIMGQSPKKEEVNRFGKGLPLLNGPTEFGEYCPIPVQFTEYPKKIAPKGSLLFCVRGSTTGRMNWADQDYAIGRGLATIIPNDTRMGEYLRNSINYNLEYLLSSATGSTFPNVSANLLSSFPVQIVQNTVEASNLLDVISKKKLVNEQSIYKLEQLAQTLFKRWFVDFEFPNENGEPYKSSGGEMFESELGIIPKDWEVVNLSEGVKIQYGKSMPMKKLKLTGYPVYGANGVIGFTEEFLYEEAQVIMTCRGNGSGDVFKTVPKSFVTNNSLVLEDIHDFGLDFLRLMVIGNNPYNFKTGSAQPQITITNIGHLKIVLPTKRVLKNFDEIMVSISNMGYSYELENGKLKKLSDALLPKLLSGEIEIPDETEVTENVPIS